MLAGKNNVIPKGKPIVIGRISIRIRLSPSLFANQLPRVRKSWVSWPPIDTAGTIGTPACMAVLTYPVRPPKSMTFWLSVGRNAS